MKTEFVNAQEMAKKNPLTFEVPSRYLLNKIKVGTHVKVCVGDERFWVLVSNVNGKEITGTVDNNLVNTFIHGLKCNDVITFKKENVYSIFTKQVKKEAEKRYKENAIGHFKDIINK